jgi:CDP-glucose 4,6-dehydratase
VITTDKVYKDLNSNHPYSELDQLGGKDIYSASKAMADLLVQSWIASFNGPPISLARAGNVIGGGDFSSNRLIPDIYRSLVTNKTIKLRNPSSIRPWQHVLDCLSGYLMAVDKALTTKSPQIWNFGPSQDSKKSVQDLVEAFLGEKRIQVKIDYETLDISETEQINLDVSKANKELGWRNVLDFKDTVDLVSDWYFQFLQGKNSLTMIENQIEYFENLLIKQNMVRTHI